MTMTAEDYAQLDAEFARAIGRGKAEIMILDGICHVREHCEWPRDIEFEAHVNWNLVMPEAIKREIIYRTSASDVFAFPTGKNGESVDELFSAHPDLYTAIRVCLMRAVIEWEKVKGVEPEEQP